MLAPWLVLLLASACGDAAPRSGGGGGEGEGEGSAEGEGEGSAEGEGEGAAEGEGEGSAEGEGEGPAEGEGEGEGEGGSGCATAEAGDEPVLHGRLVVDADAGDVSVYKNDLDEEADSGLAGVPVSLMGAFGVEYDAVTCRDGTFTFSGLDDGAYLVVPEFPAEERCMRKNCPSHAIQAIWSGKLKMVTLGDSIAVVGSPEVFPKRLEKLLKPLATVEEKNVAIPGTTSTDWLPGTSNFDNRLAPELADADLVLITLGGNDLLQYASNPALLNDIPGALDGAGLLVLQIVENVRTIVQAIREENSKLDIVYILYVDYTRLKQDQMWLMATGFLGEQPLRAVLESALDAIPDDENLILVDMFGRATGLALDDLMYDSLHFNGLGHILYAEEIFKTLGGVLVGDSPLGDDGQTPLGLNKTWSFAE